MRNNAFKVILLLIYILQETKTQTPRPGECPIVLPVEDFDDSRFQGRWYEQRRSPRDREDDLECISFIFTPDIEGNNYITLERLATKKITLETDYVSNQAEILQPGQIASPDGFIYTVLYTDYENNAILYGCKNNEDDLTFLATTWIWTRQKNPANLRYILDLLDYLNVYITNWVIVDQTRCFLT